METLVDVLAQSADRHGARPALSLHGREPWTWTYADLWENARRAAALLRTEGIGKGDRVVMWGPNRPEWVAAFFGAQILGAAVVPLDVRSKEDLLDRIEGQTRARHLILGQEQARSLRGAHAPITVLEELQGRLAQMAPVELPAAQLSPDDIAELVFTSGTTGNPKGVILTHRNIVFDARMGGTRVRPTPANHVISLLPLSHMFEQTTGLIIPMMGGASITYVASLRPDQIFSAMAWSKSTNMSCVPQVLQLFRDGVEREVRKQGKEQRFNQMLRIAGRLPLSLRRLIFRAVHRRFGGSFDFFVCGGARLDPDLHRWWEALGVKVIQGYGMTEAAPVVACHTMTDRNPETVGLPLPGVDVRIGEGGEVLVRGPNVTPGYWENEQATAEAFVDGWYRSGDLGAFDAQGHLRLRGRLKNMIVLANGMNVYAEDVENVLASDPRVKDAVVLGLTRGQDVEIHAVLLGCEPEECSAVVKAANAKLQPHQQIRGHTRWPDETFPLTPTLKVKRAEVAERVEALRAQTVGASGGQRRDEP